MLGKVGGASGGRVREMALEETTLLYNVPDLKQGTLGLRFGWDG